MCGRLGGEDSPDVKSSRLVVRPSRLVVGLVEVGSARLVGPGVGRGEEEEGEIEQGGGEGEPGEHCGEQLTQEGGNIVGRGLEVEKARKERHH